MRWFLDNLDEIRVLALHHLWLSVVPVIVGFVLALPIGWLANRFRRVRGPLIGVVGVLYALPSLPLLIILPGVIGTSFLDPSNVAIVLSIYALAVMVRTACDAFGQVPAEALESAAAAGYSPLQRVVAVELPLAGPVLLSGLRVVSVSTVSLVTVGALIGVSNLGSLFTDGFQRGFRTEIVIGVLAVVVLALVLDALWVAIGALLMPWRRA
jgi:osmoprotectant transport system permease protein